jgi:hypothetical protein
MFLHIVQASSQDIKGFNKIAPTPREKKKKRKNHHKIGGKKMLAKSSCDKSFQKKLPKKIESHQILLFSSVF